MRLSDKKATLDKYVRIERAYKDGRRDVAKKILREEGCRYCDVFLKKGCRGCPLKSDLLCGVNGEGTHAVIWLWANKIFDSWPDRGAHRAIRRIILALKRDIARNG